MRMRPNMVGLVPLVSSARRVCGNETATAIVHSTTRGVGFRRTPRRAYQEPVRYWSDGLLEAWSLRLQTDVELELDLELERPAAPVTTTRSRSEICLNAHRSSLPVHPALFTLLKIRTKTSGRNRVIAAIYWGRPLLEATGHSVIHLMAFSFRWLLS